jgi:hypothetical protein
MTSATPAPREPDGETGTRPGEPAPPDNGPGRVNGAYYPPAVGHTDDRDADRGDNAADRTPARPTYPDYPGASGQLDGSDDPYASGQLYAYPGAPPGPWSIYPPPTALAAEPGPSGKAKSLTALAVAAVIAVLGLLLGWIWSVFAPWLPGVVESDGVFLQQPYGEQRAGQETWFILLSIGAGILFGIIAWVALRRFRGPLMVVALAVGGVASGWIAWRFGHNIGRGHALAEARAGKIGQVVLIPPDLRIKQAGNIGLWHGWLPYLSGVLLYLAIAAIVTYLLIASFTASPALVTRRRGRTATPQPDSAKT